MSFVKVNDNNFEYSGIELHPEVHYISSSISLGMTGSATVSANNYNNLYKVTEKGDLLLSVLKNPVYWENNDAKISIALSDDRINNKDIPIFRFDPPFQFNVNSVIKNNVRKVLMPYHKHRYQNCNFSYSNYNSLNFISKGTLPKDTAIVYNNNKGIYNLSNPFCLSFWINPRYTGPDAYKAGTIFHLSSSISVSLVTGSSRDENNKINDYKILLQLSQSADTPPSNIDINNLDGIYPNDLVYTSSHYLKKDHWHNVTIQWSNSSKGSLFIDKNETEFEIPSSSLAATIQPNGLVIGNWYEGSNEDLANLLGAQESTRQGFDQSDSASTYINPNNNFNHPLNAEIHEVKLLSSYMSETIRWNERLSEIDVSRYKGINDTDFENCQFFLGPYFQPDINERDVLMSPYRYKQNSVLKSTTTSPFNLDFSFRVGGKLLNLENFVVDLKNNNHPRLVNLFPEKEETSRWRAHKPADEFIYESDLHKRINLSILPCDNGLFSPNYEFYSLIQEFEDYNIFNLENEQTDYSIINISNNNQEYIKREINGIESTESFFDSVTGKNIVNLPESITGFNSEDNDTILQSLCGPNPQKTGNPINNNENAVPASDIMFIPYMTKDASSNNITIFDISNLYYGNAIQPNSFEIIENSLTGSDGNISIKLKDNGLGSLYRADCKTKQATWNNVGNIFYEEGIAIIKSPHLVYFCKDRNEIKLRGTQNIHSMILNVPAYKNLFNSSSNPTFQSIPPSDNTSDEDLKSMYITTVNIHDNNFNIIMKANFSQPIIKTRADEFIIRLKEDF